jgi:hypothetical protein
MTFLIIGAIFGHILTVRHHCGHHMSCCPMMRMCGGGSDREMWQDRNDWKCRGGFEHKFPAGKDVCNEPKGWFEHKDNKEKCPAAGLPAEPNKDNCPMMDKSKKD